MHGGDFILEVGGGDWASHMMEHELGGMFDVAHGAGFADNLGNPGYGRIRWRNDFVVR